VKADLTTQDAIDRWQEFLSAVRARDRILHAVLLSAQPVFVHDNTVCIRLTGKSDANLVSRDSNLHFLQETLSLLLGRPIELRCILPGEPVSLEAAGIMLAPPSTADSEQKKSLSAGIDARQGRLFRALGRGERTAAGIGVEPEQPRTGGGLGSKQLQEAEEAHRRLVAESQTLSQELEQARTDLQKTRDRWSTVLQQLGFLEGERQGEQEKLNGLQAKTQEQQQGLTCVQAERDRLPNRIISSFNSGWCVLLEAMALAGPESHTKHTSDWYNFWGTPLTHVQEADDGSLES